MIDTSNKLPCKGLQCARAQYLNGALHGLMMSKRVCVLVNRKMAMDSTDDCTDMFIYHSSFERERERRCVCVRERERERDDWKIRLKEKKIDEGILSTFHAFGQKNILFFLTKNYISLYTYIIRFIIKIY